MSATSPGASQLHNTRRQARRIVSAFAVLVIVVAAVWWYGPWNTEARYERMDVLGLRHRVTDHPNDAVAWRVLALRLAHDGDAQLAEPALRQAMALDPKDPRVSTGLSELLINTNRADEGFQILKMTIGQHPRFVQAHLDLGRLYRKRGSYHHAAEQFEAAVAVDNKDADVWYVLAQCYLDMQQVSRAQIAIQKALELEPKNPRFLMFSGNLDLGAGHPEEGMARAREAAALAPRDVAIQANMATVLIQHHRDDADTQQAEQIVGNLEQLQPDYPPLPLLRGDLETLRQHWDAASRYYQKALQTVPDQDQVYYSLGQAYRRLGRIQDADRLQAIYVQRQKLRQQIDDVRVAIGGQPQNAALYRKLAELEFHLGNRAGAIHALQMSLDLDPHSEFARKHLEQLQRLDNPPPAGNP